MMDCTCTVHPFVLVWRIGGLKYRSALSGGQAVKADCLNDALSPACWRDGDRDGFGPGPRSTADVRWRDQTAPRVRSLRQSESAGRRPAARRFGARETRLRRG